MAKPIDVFLKNITDLTDDQAKIVWNIGHTAKIITAECPAEPTGKLLKEAVGDIATVTKLARALSAMPGQEGVVQMLYGRPVKSNSGTAKLPQKTVAPSAKGRPATGNNSGRYSNAGINPNHFVIVKCANPKRAGTASHARFAKYRNGATVAANIAIEGGPRMDDIRWDLLRNHIELSPEAPVQEKKNADSPKTKPGKNGVTIAANA
jgi:hypothetical protein